MNQAPMFPTDTHFPRRLQSNSANHEKTVPGVLAQGKRRPGQDTQHILKVRAARLARDPARLDALEAHLEVVEFRLAEERYALELPFIREVYPLRDLTPLCCTPPFVRGLVNVRGHILSVIDLKYFFELPMSAPTKLTRIIIVATEAMDLGIQADVVLGVRSVSLHTIQPSLPTLTGIREDYLYGVAPDGLVILAADKLLADTRLLVHEEVEL